MRKYLSGLVTGLLISAMTMAFAAELNVVPNPFPILVNGEKKDIEALNVDGDTYLKLRNVGDATGASVAFNAEKKQIEIAVLTPAPVQIPTSNPGASKETKISLKLGESFEKDGFKVTLKEVKNISTNPDTGKVTKKYLVYEIINPLSTMIPSIESLESISENTYIQTYSYSSTKLISAPTIILFDQRITITWDIDLAKDMGK